MPFHEMWVHGSSATAQFGTRNRGAELDIDGRAWTAVVGFHSPRGVEYRCQNNTEYSFHFAIPTPVIINDSRTFLRKVMVLFTCDPFVTLNSLSVQVGTRDISVPGAEDIAIGADNSSITEGRNSFELPPDLRAAFGVGVSARFRFSDIGNVTLHGAGVIFESIPPTP